MPFTTQTAATRALGRAVSAGPLDLACAIDQFVVESLVIPLPVIVLDVLWSNLEPVT